MQKVAYEWSHEGITNLIELWRSVSCLFNLKDPYYHNKNRQNNALQGTKDTLLNYGVHLTTEDVNQKVIFAMP